MINEGEEKYRKGEKEKDEWKKGSEDKEKERKGRYLAERTKGLQKIRNG